MNRIGKCYVVKNNDEETVAQWPEIKTGFKFLVLAVENRDGLYEGATKIRCLSTGKVFDVNLPLHNGDESWFWCLVSFCDEGEVSLEEIECPLDLPVPTEIILSKKETLILAIEELISCVQAESDVNYATQFVAIELQNLLSEIKEGEL